MAKEKKRILLVEDDKYLVMVYKTALEREGFEVDIAYDGTGGVEKVMGDSFDLILLDLMLPSKNGFDFLKEIKAGEAWKNIPVLVLSNLGQDADVKRAMDLGADDYMVKANFSMKQVISKIKSYLK